MAIEFLAGHGRDHKLILGRTGPFRIFPTYKIPYSFRATHLYVIGITGQGKSKLLQNLLVQDIVSGHGCGLVDPHSDLANDVLAHLYQIGFFLDRVNSSRIIYFDPSRSDFVMPFNVLASSFPPYTIASNCVEAFKRTWPESLKEAPRFSNILMAALLTLIANRMTLVELPRLMVDKDFRECLLQNVEDYEVISVFRDRLDRWGREQPMILESILNKIGALLLNPSLKAILGQKENFLDFRRIMDEGKVLIVDLGRCDGETRRLLGSLIVTGVEQAALSRKDTDHEHRRPFYFFMDEFQDFVANEGSVQTFSQILSEARKFGLSLTLAHQTLGQLNYDRMMSALGNVGTKIVFAVDRADAELMAKKIFSVNFESIKHEVVSNEAQERTHPVYYSLNEEWECAIQQIQSLKPRSFFVKIPQKTVAKVYSMPMSPSNIGSAMLGQLCSSLAEQSGHRVGANPNAQAQDHIRHHTITNYELINSSV